MTDTAVSADHDETSVPALWDAARWFMHWLISVCGAASEIAALTVLVRKERREILFWLRPVEALVRRLLVAEAARVAAGLPPGRPGQGRANGARPCRSVSQDPEDPGRWAVRFSVSPRTGERRRARRPVRRSVRLRPPARDRCDDMFERMRRRQERLEAAELRKASQRETSACVANCNITPPAEAEAPAPGRPGSLFSPRPLAGRIEAVRRVLEDPKPYVTRLAQRLARRRDGYTEHIARACRPPPERPRAAMRRYGETSVRHASKHAQEALQQLSVIRYQESEGLS